MVKRNIGKIYIYRKKKKGSIVKYSLENERNERAQEFFGGAGKSLRKCDGPNQKKVKKK